MTPINAPADIVDTAVAAGSFKVPGKVRAADVVKISTATTAGGGAVSIRVEGGRVYVGPARVLKTDIVATNGVIHVIDAVLMPK